MTVAHSTLTGSSLHENKGVSAASEDTVATATSGATVWKKLTTSNLTASVNSFATQRLYIREEKTTGVAAGASVATTWQKRSLNTVKLNNISGASLASGQIILPAGSYYLEAHAPANSTGGHRLRFRNITDSTTTDVGLSCYCAQFANNYAPLISEFTIAGTKTFELQHYTVSAVSTYGLGYFSSSGEAEVYAEISIWKTSS